MTLNPDRIFFRDRELDPDLIAAVGLESSLPRTGRMNEKERFAPPDRLWCIVYEASGDSDSFKYEFVHEQHTLEQIVGTMMSRYKWQPSNDPEPRKKVQGVWKLSDGEWVQLLVEHGVTFKQVPREVEDDG